MVPTFKLLRKNKIDNTEDNSNLYTDFRVNKMWDEVHVALDKIRGDIRGLQSKVDTLISNQTAKASIDVSNLKNVAVAHAERIDAIAKFLKIDYIDKVETKVTKEYQPVKKQK